MARLTEAASPFTGHVVERAEGLRLHLDDGRELIDLSASLAVTATGHNHPHVVEAVREQVGSVVLAQSGVGYNRPLLELAERLGPLLPEGLDRLWTGGTGAEAVEAAVRLARQATERPNIIAFDGGFHGRSVGAAALTSSTGKVRAGTGPLPAGVSFAPFPAASRYRGLGVDATDFALDQLDRILATTSQPRETAAFLVEAVQGEGGYVPATARFFAGLRRRADEHGILVIVDEVQAGWGRTGRFWAFDHFGARPDLITMGKGMGSGFPISAVAAPKGIFDRAWPGSLGGTFSGHVVSAAAALATLEVFEREGLVENAATQGRVLLDALREACSGLGAVAEVRGLGLMIGLELRDESGAPGTALAARVQREALERGLLVLTCGIHKETLRIAPALTLGRDDIERAVPILRDAILAASEREAA